MGEGENRNFAKVCLASKKQELAEKAALGGAPAFDLTDFCPRDINSEDCSVEKLQLTKH